MGRKALVLVALLFPHPVVQAQDRPAVFVHGLHGVGSWDQAAERLHRRLAITPFVPVLAWRETFESQAGSLQAQYGPLPSATLAIGHSNGGIASRQWSTLHPLSAIVTVGSPQQGAPIVNHILDLVGFNNLLYNYMGLAGSAFGMQPNEWSYIFLFVQAALLFGQGFAVETVVRLGAVLGLQLGAPVLPQMAPGSYLLNQLNGGGNLSREASAIPARIGLAYVASNYWQAGPARALDPDNADVWYARMVTSVASLEVAANYLWVYYPWNSWAVGIANGLYSAASLLRQVDPTWCWAVTDDATCNTPHDGVVPFWSQIYPGAINFGVGGPAHTQETRVSDDALVYVLNTQAGVPGRGSGGPLPGGPGGPDTLSAGEALVPGESKRSPDGRFELSYQGDGNLVLYRLSDGRAIWSTGTFSPGEVAMQHDGNLVVYSGDGTPLWSSGTAGYPGARLAVQSDGNLVIYDYYGYARWSSGTAQ